MKPRTLKLEITFMSKDVPTAADLGFELSQLAEYLTYVKPKIGKKHPITGDSGEEIGFWSVQW